MDEILATIRRIIAEDERSSGAAGRGVPADGLRDTTVAHEAEEAGNDVLDLTDVLNEDGNVRRLEPIATVPDAGELGPAPVPAETKSATPPAISAKPPEASPRTDPSPTDKAISEANHATDPDPLPSAAQPPGATDERLVSDVAALAAATAFGRIGAVPRVRREAPAVGGRPLDEIVRRTAAPAIADLARREPASHRRAPGSGRDREDFLPFPAGLSRFFAKISARRNRRRLAERFRLSKHDHLLATD